MDLILECHVELLFTYSCSYYNSIGEKKRELQMFTFAVRRVLGYLSVLRSLCRLGQMCI